MVLIISTHFPEINSIISSGILYAPGDSSKQDLHIELLNTPVIESLNSSSVIYSLALLLDINLPAP